MGTPPRSSEPAVQRKCILYDTCHVVLNNLLYQSTRSFWGFKGLAAASINVKLREMMASGRYGTDMRVTMGIIETVDGTYCGRARLCLYVQYVCVCVCVYEIVFRRVQTCWFLGRAANKL